jgi:hypothetical protein
MYNVTLRRIRKTTATAHKPQVLHTPVCVHTRVREHLHVRMQPCSIQGTFAILYCHGGLYGSTTIVNMIS